MSVVEQKDSQQLHGHWRLVSFLEQRGDEWVAALGAEAKACLSYWPNGQMQVLIGAADRPRFRGEWSAIPDAEKAVCLDRMVAYAGRYTVAKDRVLHHVEICWIPNWERRDLVRRVDFPAPNQLLLSTVDDPDGRPRPAQRVLWERSE